MNEKLQLIREKCIAANPEIVELKFGCRVDVRGFTSLAVEEAEYIPCKVGFEDMNGNVQLFKIEPRDREQNDIWFGGWPGL